MPEGLGNDSSLSDECFEPDFRITQVIIGAAPKAPQGNETLLTPNLLLAQGENRSEAPVFHLPLHRRGLAGYGKSEQERERLFTED